LNDVLNLLPTAKDAPFNAYQRRHDPTCLRDTRVDLLRDIYSWADGQDERCIFWLNGLAGTGKSTIARTIARRYLDQKRLGASFFFSRGGGDVGHAGKFVTSIAWQLASSVPSLDQYVCDAIKEHPDIASQSPHDQWQQLVLRPLSRLSGSRGHFSYMLIVDALDECDNDMDTHVIVHLLAKAQLLRTTRLRIFLTSRPEVPIRNGFGEVPDGEHKDFVLHNIPSSTIDHDILIFLEHNLRLTRVAFCLSSVWPSEEDIIALKTAAGGLFIWAATACRFIHAGRALAADCLSIVLKRQTPVDESASLENYSSDDSAASENGMISPEENLNEIYRTVLKRPMRNYPKERRRDWYRLLKDGTGTVVLLFSPLSPMSVARLLGPEGERCVQILKDLQSILDISENQTLPIHLHHPSFRDFLLDKTRCGTTRFWVDEKKAHRTLAERCVRLMSASLQKDICTVRIPGTLVTEVERSRLDKSLPLEVQYACLYWIQHVQRSGAHLTDSDQVLQFLQTHLLHWLEALGWMGKVSEGFHAIASLEPFTAVSISLE
jgi:hypothetical protein